MKRKYTKQEMAHVAEITMCELLSKEDKTDPFYINKMLRMYNDFVYTSEHVFKEDGFKRLLGHFNNLTHIAN